MKTILLIRHGETAARAGAFCGSTNVALSKVGQQQSREILQLLATHNIELVVTSGLQRTDYYGQRAAIHGRAHVIDTDLREINFGSWEGQTWAEIEKHSPAAAAIWLAHPDTMRFPEGESMPIFRQRVQNAWQRLMTRPEMRIAIIGHSGVLSFVLQYAGITQQPTYLQCAESMAIAVAKM